ncbi:hypothetical protein [Mycoplasmopsis edwardii]|nr:hypothetical protein [Mycoplasmopsis edwardii]
MKKLFKNFKNKILLSVGILSGLSLLTWLVSVKVTSKFKPSFYNYKSYMSEINVEKLNETFDYKEFDEINQFSNALINNKAVAGIGSEFLATELVRKKLIGKIDYSSLLNIPALDGMLEYDKLKNIINSDEYKDYSNEIKSSLQRQFNEASQKRDLARKFVKLTLREEIWNHLSKYELKNGSELWEYFYPYFSQDMVIGYNIKKVPLNSEVIDPTTGGINFASYKDKFKNDDIKDPYSLINILKIMTENNYNQWYITDAVRDNMLYGSSYWPLPEGRTDQRFTGKVLDSNDNGNQNYKILIDAFSDLIKDGTGFDIKNNKHISFKGDGLEIVNDLINPSRPDVTIAIMYNGDAIDSYYGSDNFEGTVEDGEIRAIKPKNNILLLDGFVVSSDASKDNAKKYTAAVSETIFSGSRDVIESYNELLEAHLIEDISNVNENTDKFNYIQTKVSQERIAKNWNIMKENQLNTLLEEKEIEDYKQKTEALSSKYTNLINLSLSSNSEKFSRYYELKNKKAQNLEYDTDQEISLIPYFFKEYLEANFDDFLSNIASNIKKEDFNIESLLSENFEQNVFVYMFIEDKESLNEHLGELEQSEVKEFITLYLSRKLAFIDLSDDINIGDRYNFNNFNFVNYVPTVISDYEQILQNYFLDVFEGHDKNAIYLYEISNANGVVHENIQPVSDELQSKLTTYYFNKTKS